MCNPEKNDGWTPLHSAAKNGHLKICEYITVNIENKNPGRNDGYYHSNMHISIWKLKIL